jgi:hypothetical protein
MLYCLSGQNSGHAVTKMSGSVLFLACSSLARRLSEFRESVTYL